MRKSQSLISKTKKENSKLYFHKIYIILENNDSVGLGALGNI
jgi:hypothetical protein